jgi:hypothetical protein
MGNPTVLAGESSAHAKPLFDFARHVADKIEQIQSAAPAGVIQIQ